MEVGAVREQLDLRVPDRVALDEIELYAEVLSAVAICDRPLTDAELDAVLGIDSVVTVDLARSTGQGYLSAVDRVGR
jgi:hypothetical protein